MDIKGSKILVTGGSLGIGKETARQLVGLGAEVIITGRNKERVDAAAEEIGAIALQADVANEADIDKTYAAVNERFGGLDCLLNNAGIGRFTTLEEFTAEQFHEVMNVNVLGAALMAQRAATIMKKAGSGTIVNIGSTAALRGFERGTIYTASKFALRGMNQSWQAELRRENIRVMQINLSEVATAFNNPERVERDAAPNKLRAADAAQLIISLLQLDQRAMVPEVQLWATNPW